MSIHARTKEVSNGSEVVVKAKKQVQTAALFLTKAELAVATNTCERTISREIDKGTIKAIKIGSAVRIPKTELTRLLACIESA